MESNIGYNTSFIKGKITSYFDVTLRSCLVILIEISTIKKGHKGGRMLSDEIWPFEKVSFYYIKLAHMMLRSTLWQNGPYTIY